MRNALLYSIGLHALILALVFAGLPDLFKREPLEELAVAVEVVTDADLPKERPKPPEPKREPPPKKEAPPPPPPPQAALPEPEPPEPEPVPKPKPVEQKKPEPPKPKAEPEPPRQVAKAPPAPRRRPKPPPDEFQTLLKNLAQEAKQRPKEEPEKKKAEAKPLPPEIVEALKERPRISNIERQRLTAGLQQQVREQITPCWNIPVGAKDAHRMRIGVRIYLNPDGSLRGAPRLEDRDRLSNDPFYRALAESALRAVRNPRCSPLRLPQDQYDIWKEISFNFDPREALNP